MTVFKIWKTLPKFLCDLFDEYKWLDDWKTMQSWIEPKMPYIAQGELDEYQMEGLFRIK